MAKKNRLQRFIQSKYLFRRLVIIAIMLVVLIFISIIVRQILSPEIKNSEEHASSNFDVNNTDSITEPIEMSLDTTDTSSDTSDINLETTEVATLNVETTSENSSETTVTSIESTESNTTSTQEVNMDFSKVSYYIESNNARYKTYLNLHLSKTADEIVLAVNMNHDFDFYTNIIPVTEPGKLDVICNKYYQLSSSFTPENLVNVTSGYFVNDGKEYKLTQNALDAFVKMADAAKKEDLKIKIISGYRTYAYQENLYNKYKANNGQAAADRFSARPGHSEHETGLAIDINDVSQAFENTREFVWLQDNAHLYGYILRYPDGNEATTGYMYEPWHYRYLGVELAKKVHDSGLTYDEYYAKFLLK